MIRFSTLAAALAACAGALATPATAQTAQGNVVGITFVGRMVSNLDRSVAFYEALGFSKDPAASSVWRRDAVVERLYHIPPHGIVETRMAKMFVRNEDSGERFVLYLRELKGLERRNLADHTAWEPGASHFGLVVADAGALWSRLRARGLLRARSWGGALVAPPGQTKGMLAYMTDPDGLDIELIDQRPPAPAENGRRARPGLLPGVNHVGLVVLDSDRARAFYGNLLGGRLVTAQAPWVKGDFYDSAVGGHGNILRFYNESFAFAAESSGAVAAPRPPRARMNVELVEFQNRKKPVEPRSITDIGVGYVGFEVDGLDAFLARARAAGATVVSDGIVTMRSGTREVMVRDPDVGGFVELFEHAR
ncbi:MAG TPA: VOC family protein [Steroidobacteraceae bacterium]|nr:VOC family protein [Steroidobacteraceae bacterium]